MHRQRKEVILFDSGTDLNVAVGITIIGNYGLEDPQDLQRPIKIHSSEKYGNADIIVWNKV